MSKRTTHFSVRLPQKITDSIYRIMAEETRNKTNAIEHLLTIAINFKLRDKKS